MRTFGEMTTLHMGSHLWVLLNSDRAIGDIISKRSRITNERPRMPIAGDLVSHGKRAVIRPTAQWTEGRRITHQLLSGTSLKSYETWLELESCQLLLSSLQQPERWYRHHYQFATAIIYQIIMGVRLDKTQQQLDDYQQITMEFLFSLFRSPVDFFPKLAALPRVLQFWRPRWEAMGHFHRRVLYDWWEPVRAAVRDGTAGPSFVREVLLHPDTKYKGDDEEAMYLATSVMAAGGDNTRMTLNVAIMASLCYPAAFQRARDEIDRVCSDGTSMRLPRLDDLDALPYFCAFIKELFRWRPTVPLIPPHQLTEDLEYEGHRFPKGTNFLINNIAACSECKDADRFEPERWMDGNQGNVAHGLWAFGGGRRTCVGSRVEQHILCLALSRLIFCFDYAAVSFSPSSSDASIFVADPWSRPENTAAPGSTTGR
jgi:cytochrome P450